MNLFDLFAKLTLDSSEYEKGLKDAEDKAGGFGGKLKTAMKVGAAAVAAVTTEAVALGTSLVKGAADVAEYGDNIDKMSQKLGLSTEKYQQWDYVLSQAGADIDSMSVGMKTLTNKLDDAKNGGADAQAMFEKLGLSMEDLNNMSREDVFEQVIYGFQGMADSTERAALANDLFGRSGQELTPLFNSSVESTKELMQASKDLGMVMSDEAVGGAVKFHDALDTLQRVFGGAKNKLLGDFMPSLTTVMTGLTELISGNGGLDKINEGIEQFVGKIANTAPKLLTVGSQILVSLGDAIIANLPLLINSAGVVLKTLGEGLLQQLPTIVAVGLDILMSLATGIADSLPTLIPTIVDVVLQIVDTLTQPDTLSALVDASIAIMLALADGLIDAIPQLIEAIPTIIENLVFALADNGPKLIEAGLKLVLKLAEGIIKSAGQLLAAAPELILSLITGIVRQFQSLLDTGKRIVDSVKDGFKQKVEEAKNWGRDLIQNFLDGIKQKWENLKQTVSNVAQTVKNFLGFSEPKEGPLSDFHTYAPDMMMLFAQGIEQNAGLLRSTLTKALDFSTVSPEFPELQYSGRAVFGGYGAAYGVSEIVLLLQLILERIPSDVRLDSGELVGWLDNALGIRAEQKRRGN